MVSKILTTKHTTNVTATTATAVDAMQPIHADITHIAKVPTLLSPQAIITEKHSRGSHSHDNTDSNKYISEKSTRDNFYGTTTNREYHQEKQNLNQKQSQKYSMHLVLSSSEPTTNTTTSQRVKNVYYQTEINDDNLSNLILKDVNNYNNNENYNIDNVTCDNRTLIDTTEYINRIKCNTQHHQQQKSYYEQSIEDKNESFNKNNNCYDHTEHKKRGAINSTQAFHFPTQMTTNQQPLPELSTSSPPLSPLSTTLPDINEQISQLFPKCRPKHYNKRNILKKNKNQLSKPKKLIELNQKIYKSNDNYRSEIKKHHTDSDDNVQHNNFEYNCTKEKFKQHQEQKQHNENTHIIKPSYLKDSTPSTTLNPLTSVSAYISTNPFLISNNNDSTYYSNHSNNKYVNGRKDESQKEEAEEEAEAIVRQLQVEEKTNLYLMDDEGTNNHSFYTGFGMQYESITIDPAEYNTTVDFNAVTKPLLSSNSNQSTENFSYKPEQLKKESFRKESDYLQQINGTEIPRRRSSLCEQYQYTTTTATSLTEPITATTATIKGAIESGIINSSNKNKNAFNNVVEKRYHKQQQKQQHQQMTNIQSNQNPFIRDNYLESKCKHQHSTALATRAALDSPGYTASDAIVETKAHNAMLVDLNKTTEQGEQLPNSPKRKHDNDSSLFLFDEIQKRKNYNIQQLKNHQKVNLSLEDIHITHAQFSLHQHFSRPSSLSSTTPENWSERKRELEQEADCSKRNKPSLNKECNDKFTSASSTHGSIAKYVESQKEHRERYQYSKRKLHSSHAIQCPLIENILSPISNRSTDLIYDDNVTKNLQQFVSINYKSNNNNNCNDNSNNNKNQYKNGGIHDSLNNPIPTHNIIYISNDLIQQNKLSSTSYACTALMQSDFEQNHFNFNKNLNNNMETAYQVCAHNFNGDCQINVEPKQSIIEYEGSPRRFGKIISSSQSDHEFDNEITEKKFLNNQQINTANASKVASPKQFGMRPGFPQRITSAPRNTIPAIMILNIANTNNKKNIINKGQLKSQKSASLDNNAEDTGNNVSEIGTISYLTTSDTKSTINTIALNEKHTSNNDNNADNRNYSENRLITKELEMATKVTCNCDPLSMTSSIETTVVNTSTTFTSVINNPLSSIPTKSTTFNYLYEFSETRKVLEEFFKCQSIDAKPIFENTSDIESVDIQYEFQTNLERDNNEADDIHEKKRTENNNVCLGDKEDNNSSIDVNINTRVTKRSINEMVNDHDDDNNYNENSNTQPRYANNTDAEEDILHVNEENNITNNLQISQAQFEKPQEPVVLSQQIKRYSNKKYQQQQKHQQTPSNYLLKYDINAMNGTGQMLNDDADYNDDDGSNINNVEQFQRNNCLLSQQRQHHTSKTSLLNHNCVSPYVTNNRDACMHNNAKRCYTDSPLIRDVDYFLDSVSCSSSSEQYDYQQYGLNFNYNHHYINSQCNYQYSPETTDYNSNCGDLDSFSEELNGMSTSCSNYTKYYTRRMPVLEDGLSSGHASDTENNSITQTNFLKEQILNVQQTPTSDGISVLMSLKMVSTNNSNNSMNSITISNTDDCTANKRNLLSPSHSSESAFLHTNSKNGSPLNNLFSNSNQNIEHAKIYNRDNINSKITPPLISPNCLSINKVFNNIDPDLDSLYSISIYNRNDVIQMTPPPPAPAPHRKPNISNNDSNNQTTTSFRDLHSYDPNNSNFSPKVNCSKILSLHTNESLPQDQITIINPTVLTESNIGNKTNNEIESLAEINAQLPPLVERVTQRSLSPTTSSPIWLSRHSNVSVNKTLLDSPADTSKHFSGDEEDIDTDLETDRLLGHQRLDDEGYYDENKSWDTRPSRPLLSKISPKQIPSCKTRNGYNALISSTAETSPAAPKNLSHIDNELQHNKNSSISSPEQDHYQHSPIKSKKMITNCGETLDSPVEPHDSIDLYKEDNYENSLSPIYNTSNCESSHTVLKDTNNDDIDNGDELKNCYGNGSDNFNIIDSSCTITAVKNNNSSSESVQDSANNTTTINGEKKIKKSGAVLIEGVLFRAKYLGSTQLVCEGQPTKSTRMMQAEEAVSRIKAPDGDVQPSTEVDLFISTEKIMVLNTDLKEIMMDHALRTISYIADIGDLVVLMARRRFVPQDIDDGPKPNRTPKMICHVFESDEAQFIAQSIGQAFQVAYMEFLKANGIEDHRFVKEMDYQEVLNSQEIFGDELEIFAKKELQKEVVVPKTKGEILGVVIVESGWGSMLPTVVIANLMSAGAAARCGQLNIGDQLIAINGLSLVGLPLSTCQNYIRNTKTQTVVKFTVVPCPPVVEVKIKRPETKYQLGFSVQNGVICSLLRGGIAERGGVRVGHRIIEINNQSVVAVPHEKIVNLLATSVGEILMKTMPTSMFRLLTGQENPLFI